MELQEGHVDEAKRWLEQSLAAYQEIGDPWWIAETLGELSQVTWTQNDLLRTQATLEECLRYYRALGDHDGLAGSLFSLGALTVFDLGQVDEGAPLLRESAELQEKSSDRVSAYRAGAARGSLLRATGQFAEELPVRQRQLAIVQDLGDLFGIADAHRIVGEVLQHLGRYAEADGEGRRSLDMPGSHPPRYLLYAFRLAWGATLLALGKSQETRQVLEENLPTLRAMMARGSLGRTLVVLSRAKLTLGDTDAAWQHALEALDLLTDRHYYWLLEPIAALALLFAQHGQVLRGVELYALAETNPLMARSRWFIDLFKQPIEAAAAALPEKEVAAARKRGQALDLWEVARELQAELNGQIVRTSVRSR
jgi:tetratricopeptide (TPR) repeat protein